MNRPKRTTADENQSIENDRLREAGCLCIVVSDLPGRRHKGLARENPLDTFVLSPDRSCWLQVEWKAKPGSPFTSNEKEYFEHLGMWNYVSSGMLDPLAQWRKTGWPIIVAWEAEQVLDVFKAITE